MDIEQQYKRALDTSRYAMGIKLTVDLLGTLCFFTYLYANAQITILHPFRGSALVSFGMYYIAARFLAGVTGTVVTALLIMVRSVGDVVKAVKEKSVLDNSDIASLRQRFAAERAFASARVKARARAGSFFLGVSMPLICLLVFVGENNLVVSLFAIAFWGGNIFLQQLGAQKPAIEKT